jgi:hypothetical protein
MDASCGTVCGDAAGRLGRRQKGPRYTYGELGYARIDFDNFNEDADVFGANGSLAVSDQIYLIAAYSDGNIDASGFDIDLRARRSGCRSALPAELEGRLHR